MSPIENQLIFDYFSSGRKIVLCAYLGVWFLWKRSLDKQLIFFELFSLGHQEVLKTSFSILLYVFGVLYWFLRWFTRCSLIFACFLWCETRCRYFVISFFFGDLVLNTCGSLLFNDAISSFKTAFDFLP